MTDFNAKRFWECEHIPGINDNQKEYLNALIDLSPHKPHTISIDYVTNYAWFRYDSFDYPVKLEYLGIVSINQFLSDNIPDLAYYLKSGAKYETN